MMVAATTVALETPIGLQAVCLTGPSGVGKSDLALRLIDSGGLLVADDQTVLRADGARLVATAPRAIAGLIEARGLGPIPAPCASEASVALIAECVPPGTVLPRLAAGRAKTLLGLARPVISVVALEASAPAKIRLVLAALAQGRPILG